MRYRFGQQQEVFRDRDLLDFAEWIDPRPDTDIRDRAVARIETKRMCVSVVAAKIPDGCILAWLQATDAHMLARKHDRRYAERQRRSVLCARGCRAPLRLVVGHFVHQRYVAHPASLAVDRLPPLFAAPAFFGRKAQWQLEFFVFVTFQELYDCLPAKPGERNAVFVGQRRQLPEFAIIDIDGHTMLGYH
jgi:hypothetical protein